MTRPASTIKRTTVAPVRTTPFPAWPYFGPDVIDATSEVLRSGKVNYWTGKEGRAFEREYAAYLGVKHSVAVMNGTVALELALHALDVGPGDDVVTTSRTFVASASSVVMRGARPMVADVDEVSQNLTAETVRSVLTPRTKAIIAVHLAGWPCDMDPIMELAAEHGIKVIEDCAQAHGATYNERQVGSIGHIGVFSFCQDKIITTGGEGGLLATNDESLYKRAWAYKEHGKDYDAVHHRDHPPGFRWLVESFGTNFRMTEMQAAIGRAMLRKLPEWLVRRRDNAALLTEHLATVPGLRLTVPPLEIGHGYYKYYAFVEPDSLSDGWDRDRIMNEISAQGVPCFSGSCSEIYLEKAFRDRNWGPAERLPVARRLGETSLMFMVHPTLSAKEMLDTANAVNRVMRRAVR